MIKLASRLDDVDEEFVVQAGNFVDKAVLERNICRIDRRYFRLCIGDQLIR